MSVLDTVKKGYLHIKTATDEYMRILPRTLASLILMNDGSTAEDSINGKLNKTSVVNNLTSTITGNALDATQGKALKDEIGSTDISAIGDGTVTGAITELNSKLTNAFRFELLGGKAATSEIVSFELSEAFTQYKFICILAYADGYADVKVIPSQLLPTLSVLSGRGISMSIKCNDSYFWQGNVGFYNNYKIVEVSTVAYNGWYGTIEIFGCK